ncbi:ABC transporter permease [Thiothrix winogradskyi]|uniref:ABC transporter permease n=1 Tax=Thiothrix winogradskyi TaxID=96472 RepID=A0ABY3SSY0_9GAMM|nr:ABC transporter permease [Thiothrix winogradskyi]UJS22627.1 ABC transporter permease [Thiothrix winogradskyi]
MLWSSFLLALREIRRNLLRSFLTILGIVIGVSAVITMVTLGNGATQAVKNQVSSLGSNLLQIRNGQRMMGPSSGGGGSPPFSLEDVAAIRSQITGLAAVAPEVSKSATVVSMSNNWSTSVTGSTTDFFIAGSWKLASGRNFSEAEEKAGQTVCLIGETIRRELFGTQQPVGESLRVNNFSCEIIGILVSKGQASMGRDQDDTVIMPIKAVQRRLTGNQNVSSIQVSVADENDITSVKEQLTNLMRERRRLGDDKDDNFNVQDTRQIAEALSGTTQVMTTLLAAVASVSLLVGGIGIMNIMLVSVTERTREIGIRLAIGALEREVLLQFLIEAVVLASLGGLVGIGLATLASIGLSQVMNVPYVFNVGINLLSFVFSAGIGVLFGYMPAKRAARLDPIEALRHE